MNNIIKKRQVQGGAKAAQGTTEASVELLKDGDVVRAIEVRCSCGNATIVELDYADPKAQGTEPR